MHLVEKEELYKDPRRVGPRAPGDRDTHGDRTYNTFQEYFEDRVKQPFAKWAELEHTYHYMQDHAPDLVQLGFADAQAEADKAREDAKRSGGEPGRPDPNAYPVRISHGGNRKEVLLRRLAHRAPEYLAAYERGEYKTAKQAARAAGIVPRIPTPFELIQKLISELTDEERAKLRELLNGRSN